MTTYYVRPTNGSDVAAGTSFANAFKTFQKAADSVVAGDDIVLCPEATETTATQVDWDVAQGTAGSTIDVYCGNTTDGARDDSLRYTLQASASMTNLFNIAANFGDYLNLRGIIFDGNSNVTGDCFRCSDAPTAMSIEFCKATGASGAGFSTAGGSANWYVGCEAYSNGANGFDGDTADGFSFRNCSAHDNTGIGFEFRNTGQSAIGCVAYDNTSHGYHFVQTDAGIISGCVAFNNSGDGLRIDSVCERNICVNNIFRSNGGYGLNNINATWEGVQIDFNCYHNNTSGHCNLVSDANINDGTVGSNNVGSNPSFISETNNSEDFGFQAGSPCLDVGISGDSGNGFASGVGLFGHIGFGVQAAGAGGGGLLVNPGLTGGLGA